MKAHHFIDGVKVQRFCLTLLGEVRLWLQSLELLHNITWPELQIYLGEDISKVGNTREQLFHAWRSFKLQ